MNDDPVPLETALEVAAFVQARARDELPAEAAHELDRRWADAALLREFEAALARGRAVTVDNLTLTLLLSAARYDDHADYRPQWRRWTPFTDLIVRDPPDA